MTMKSSSDPKRAIVSYDPQKELWTLEEDYTYVDQHYKFEITVNKGSEFDLSSVPRPLWRIISPFDLSVEAPLVHDFLYITRGGAKKDETAPMKGTITDLNQQGRTYEREEADALFRFMMQELKVKGWRAILGYWAVSVFGRLYWRSFQPGCSGGSQAGLQETII